MFFNSKSKRTVREPDESVRLSSSVEAVIWREQAKNGALDIRFGLNRIDKGNIRRTFSPAHIGELVESLAALAMAIGQSTGIDVVLASELKELGAGVVKLLEQLKANGPVSSPQSNNQRLFG